MTSLVVSCLTTLLVFGALALSGQPVLRAIGLTTGTGIVLALLLCPAIHVLARPGRDRA
jgi:predicted exporter